MKGLQIVPVRGTYWGIELNGEPVTNDCYTLAQAKKVYELYEKIYWSAWDSAIDWVGEGLQ